jgi:hypothetical protein
LIPRHPSVAKLFGSNDTEAVVRVITALLVLVLDPLAVLLTLATARGGTLPFDSAAISNI